jgi:hypothetical protein
VRRVAGCCVGAAGCNVRAHIRAPSGSCTRGTDGGNASEQLASVRSGGVEKAALVAELADVEQLASGSALRCLPARVAYMDVMSEELTHPRAPGGGIRTRGHRCKCKVQLAAML